MIERSGPMTNPILESDIRITGLMFADRTFDDGSRLIALFDCDLGPIKLRGCSLVKTAKKGFVAQAPRGENARDPGKRAITIADDSLRNSMMQAARKMYIAMGGKNGEWTKRDE